MNKRLAPIVAVATLLGGAAAWAQRDQIRIVGSSTVYPFATKVAEQFGRTTRYKTPVIESTGSGGGLKLFCAGVGVEHPDITNSSRAIKRSEVEQCHRNGVDEITEVKIGYDGIVLASSKKSAPIELSLQQLWLALAKEVPLSPGVLQPNPNRTWADIDPALPGRTIEVLGPPPTSGTRDAFVELAMERGCRAFDWIAELAESDEDRYEKICHTIREDGRFIEAGENDNLIVQKLESNPDAFGIFGFSFLDQNSDKIQGNALEGVVPTFESIGDGTYSVSRPLFFYVKKAHVGKIPGIEEFLEEFTSERAWGDGGYLSDTGLIPLPTAERRKVGNEVRSFANNVAP